MDEAVDNVLQERISDLEEQLALVHFQARIARKLRSAYVQRCRMLEARCLSLKSQAEARPTTLDLCAVCMENTLTRGMAHSGGIVHVNMCGRCAEARTWTTCPTCREPGTVVRIFWHGAPAESGRETDL